MSARGQDADRAELALTRDPDDYVALAHDAWDLIYKKVVLDDSRPVMAFGAKRLNATTAAVWGFKTERGWSAVRSATRHIRRFMIPALRDVGIRSAACLVHAGNYQSQGWLRSLGFTPRTTLHDLGAHHEEAFLFQRDEADIDSGWRH
jgi:hypothetical protein